MNGGRLDNGTKSIFIIHAIPLLEPFHHKTSFIPLNRAIRVTLGFENPFRVDEVKTRTWWNKSPRLILQKSLKLEFHSITLMRDAKSILISGWLKWMY
jgi:hypothetical protein